MTIKRQASDPHGLGARAGEAVESNGVNGSAETAAEGGTCSGGRREVRGVSLGRSKRADSSRLRADNITPVVSGGELHAGARPTEAPGTAAGFEGAGVCSAATTAAAAAVMTGVDNTSAAVAFDKGVCSCTGECEERPVRV